MRMSLLGEGQVITPSAGSYRMLTAPPIEAHTGGVYYIIKATVLAVLVFVDLLCAFTTSFSVSIHGTSSFTWHCLERCSGFLKDAGKITLI